MIRLLQYLIMGHVHKWEVLDEARLTGESWSGKSAHIGHVYFLQCKHCGDVVRRTLK